MNTDDEHGHRLWTGDVACYVGPGRQGPSGGNLLNAGRKNGRERVPGRRNTMCRGPARRPGSLDRVHQCGGGGPPTGTREQTGGNPGRRHTRRGQPSPCPPVLYPHPLAPACLPTTEPFKRSGEICYGLQNSAWRHPPIHLEKGQAEGRWRSRQRCAGGRPICTGEGGRAPGILT